MSSNDPWAIESPVFMVEGESYKFKIHIPGAAVIAGPTCKIYNNQDDTSVTNLDGAAATNGVDTITSPTVKNVKGGEIYILNFSGTVDTRAMTFLLEIRCLHPWGAQ